MALQKAGIEATVYEAYPSTADGIGGALEHRAERVERAGRTRRRGCRTARGRSDDGDGLPELDRQAAGRVRQPTRRPSDHAAGLAYRPLPGAVRRGRQPRCPHRARQAPGRPHPDRPGRDGPVRGRYAGQRGHPDRGGRHPVNGPRADRPGRAAAALRRPARLRCPVGSDRAGLQPRQDADVLWQAGVLRLPDLGRRERRLVRQPAAPGTDVDRGGPRGTPGGVDGVCFARRSPTTAPRPSI